MNDICCCQEKWPSSYYHTHTHTSQSEEFLLFYMSVYGLNPLEQNNTQYHQKVASIDIVAQFSLPSLSFGSNESKVGSFSTTLAAASNGSAISSIAQTPFQKKNYFTHLAYDTNKNIFYAGATNKILQLNINLRVLEQATTGPLLDSPQCHAGGCPEDVETSLINNHNKVMIVSHHYGESNLIACGSVRQGACEIYSLKHFPTTKQFIGIPLAANDEFASTYTFVGPAQYSWKKEEILHVGTTFTNVGDYRHDVPAISSYRLDDLNYAEFSIQQSIINIDVKYRDHFLVDYIYGFNSTDYAYFAIIQKKSR